MRVEPINKAPIMPVNIAPAPVHVAHYHHPYAMYWHPMPYHHFHHCHPHGWYGGWHDSWVFRRT